MQLVKFLARMENSRIVSFSQGRRLIACEKVKVNGLPATTLTELLVGDRVEIVNQPEIIITAEAIAFAEINI